MGALGGGWVVDFGLPQGINRDHCGDNDIGDPIRDPETNDRLSYRPNGPGCPIPGQGKYEFHTDIDITFAMSGQTDTGLTFGASIDLDESDGKDDQGNSPAFDGRAQGGEEIFVSGAFGTLTMGDTDGALDWALQEIGLGSSLGDAHTVHAGYNGNDFADGYGGQIVRYEYSFGDFAVALSANLSDGSPNDAIHFLTKVNIADDSSAIVPGMSRRDDILAAGVKYSASLAAMDLGFGIGWSQLGHDGEDDNALGASLDVEFGNGFRAILNWVDMGDSPDHEKDIVHWRAYDPAGAQANPDYAYNIAEEDGPEQYMGIGLGYVIDDWTFAVNFGQYTEDQPDTTNDPEQRGFAVVANYDLGSGAELQLGYSKSTCKAQALGVGDVGDFDYEPRTGGAVYHEACNHNDENSTLSLGVAMNF